MDAATRHLLEEIQACTLCAPHLPHGVRPVVQLDEGARILIAGQAPGRRVHASGVPFDDPSGDRLRTWLDLSRDVFYDPKRVAILPMGFCYPGTVTSGDLPPRRECAPAWRARTLGSLPRVGLTVVLGAYAQRYHLNPVPPSVTQAVADWERYWPSQIPLPHPSPRNQGWFKRNPWFESDVLPTVRGRVRELLSESVKADRR